MNQSLTVPDIWGPPVIPARTRNPDLLDHPSLPLKMNVHDAQDYNLYWKDRRAGFVDRWQSPDEPPRWEIYLTLQHPDGSPCAFEATATSVAEAINMLRDFQSTENGEPMPQERVEALTDG